MGFCADGSNLAPAFVIGFGQGSVGCLRGSWGWSCRITALRPNPTYGVRRTAYGRPMFMRCFPSRAGTKTRLRKLLQLAKVLVYFVGEMCCLLKRRCHIFWAIEIFMNQPIAQAAHFKPRFGIRNKANSCRAVQIIDNRADIFAGIAKNRR